MKYMTSIIAAAGCLTPSAHAQLNGPFWYAGAQGGLYKVTEKQSGIRASIPDPFTGQPIDGFGFAFYGEDDFETGYAVGAVLGRQLTPWFGTEAEYTFRNASFENAPDVGDDGIETHAFFGNLMFRWPTSKPVEFYGGVGAGFVANNYDLLLDGDADGEFERVSSFDNSWAVQVKGGFDWFVTDRQSFGFEASWHRGFDATADIPDSGGSEAFFEVGGVTAFVTVKRRF